MFHLEEMVNNRNKGASLFLGKYCFFDNDLLQQELVDLYIEKHDLVDFAEEISEVQEVEKEIPEEEGEGLMQEKKGKDTAIPGK